MNADWVYPLDALAAGGVIDFDAPAYILEKPVRYVGNPSYDEINKLENIGLLPEGTKMKEQPKTDEFGPPTNDNIVKTPAWKKWLMGGVIATTIGGIIAGVLLKKGKIKIPNKLSQKFKMPKTNNLKTSLKNGFNAVIEFIKKPFTLIAEKFKKKP